MMESLVMRLPSGRKMPIHRDTLEAAKRAIPIFKDDRHIASLIAAPHERIDAEGIRTIRARMRQGHNYPGFGYRVR